jgi:syntaxin-binding protein 1
VRLSVHANDLTLKAWACRYKFQSSNGVYEDKIATISDADQVWVQTRHMHMRETIDKLMADFNAFIEKNAGFSG